LLGLGYAMRLPPRRLQKDWCVVGCKDRHRVSSKKHMDCEGLLLAFSTSQKSISGTIIRMEGNGRDISSMGEGAVLGWNG
jgi:hypothetical protein